MSIVLHFSDEEATILLQKAKEAGVPAERFVRDIALRLIEGDETSAPLAET
jgi:hypothetical protein